MAKLTAKTVKALREPGRYGDGGGLYLHIAPGGTKSWVLRTTIHGKRRDMGLGGIDWTSLAEAREKARRARKVARDGGDPLAKRAKERAVLTFREATEKFHELNKGGWRETSAHSRKWLGSLERYAFPVLGEKQVDQITSADVLAVLSPIWFTKAETARRVRQRVRGVFQWAIGAGFFDGANPVDVAAGSLPRQNALRQHFPAMPWQDVPPFMAALGKRNGVSARALEFAILTCARSGEVRGARWDEIDGDTWLIPADRMKAGKAHRVPLTAPALSAVEAVRGMSRELIFPGQKAGQPMSDRTMTAVLRRMGVKVTTHGFRSTFRDWASESAHAPREVAEACLAHQVGGVVERSYARSDLFDRRRALMEEWAAFCGGGDG